MSQNPYLPPGSPPGRPGPGQVPPGPPAPPPERVAFPPAAVGPDGVVTLRALSYRSRMRWAVPVAVVAALVIAAFTRSALYVALVGGTVVVGAGFGLWAAWSARVRLTRTDVAMTRLGLRWARVRLSDVGEVILFPRIAPGYEAPHLFVVVRDRAGRRRLEITSFLFEPQAVHALAWSLGVVPAVHQRAMTARQLDRLHPGAMRWVQKHPWLLVWLVVAGTVALVVVLVLLVTSTL